MKSSLRDNFCSSPWFHLRIDPTGNYLPCRWDFSGTASTHNVNNTSLTEYLNSDIMCQLRADLLQGTSPQTCRSCKYEDQNNKVSGRQRQLLKSGILETNFNKTFCSSPHWNNFEYSNNNQGLTLNEPVDLQIDLGNTCNSACIMCPPRYSSRATDDYHKLHKIAPEQFKEPIKQTNWTDDTKLVDKFIDELKNLKSIKYIHFLGGETFYIKSFYDICNRLIDAGMSKDIIMGTTTNCTVYDDRIEHIIRNFKQVHLGISIESVTNLNDYIRWPSKIDQCLANIKKFLDLREPGLQISLRITPNIFSAWHLDSLFKFMIDNHVIAESCNILTDPACLRMELLPDDIRQEIIAKIDQVIAEHRLVDPVDIIINRRREDLVDPVISSVIFEYRNFLLNYVEPSDIENQRQDLIKFLKAYEQVHNNNILDYLPNYEEFLRSYGY